MSETLKSKARDALKRALTGLVRLAMRCGLTEPEFAGLARECFFECARADYGVRGRPTNLARIATLTGLSRKECTRLRKLLEAGQASQPAAMSPITRVISTWSNESPYAKDRQPLPLTLADGPGSLPALIRQVSGDLPPGAVITELQRLGVIANQADRTVRLLKRSYIPAGLSEDKLRILANQFEDLGGTVIHNLDDQDRPQLQRYVVSENLPQSARTEFQQLVTSKAQALLEELDQWLSQYEPKQSEASEPVSNSTLCRAGMGVYYFEDR